MGDGIPLALSWLTVLPIPAGGDIDRSRARRAIGGAPVAGILLGLVAAGLLRAAVAIGLPTTLAGLLTVGLIALATRGMHVDGLADTVDGLGCYGPPQRALEVMRSGGAGPFAVAAMVIVLGGQGLALGDLAAQGRWAAIVTAVAIGRVAVVLVCRSGVPAATPTGFGGLVAGTQSLWTGAAWAAIATAGALAAIPGTVWAGPVIVLAVLAAGVVFVAHCVRRFGGITGDVLGAVIEGSTLLVAAALTL